MKQKGQNFHGRCWREDQGALRRGQPCVHVLLSQNSQQPTKHRHAQRTLPLLNQNKYSSERGKGIAKKFQGTGPRHKQENPSMPGQSLSASAGRTADDTAMEVWWGCGDVLSL